MQILMILLAIIGGAMLSIQAATNGRLGSQLGVYHAAFLTFFLGMLITGLLIFFIEPSRAVGLLDVPKWQLMGALLGVPYIVIMTFALQKLSAATATVAVIFGQLAMSMLIDNFGWLNNTAIDFSPTRLAAVVCLGIALYFIHSSGRRKA
ncbi:DMT family transporter [Testudinibacter sp. P27/CKL/0425]